ncbi:hypothetical protein pclt_cds_761 [Pandoravirus celtis]|uniref:Uncharacterized protein n=1 Tax=Pandoravirus celtis TaxID=2568002 RepID=A0A4D6EHZ5_9VIRU|nr:hypothetical protein pclt_cds_761 [Pandoravirus celtis]
MAMVSVPAPLAVAGVRATRRTVPGRVGGHRSQDARVVDHVGRRLSYVRWKRYGQDDRILVTAAAAGHVTVLDWLHSMVIKTVPSNALVRAAVSCDATNDVDVLDWLRRRHKMTRHNVKCILWFAALRSSHGRSIAVIGTCVILLAAARRCNAGRRLFATIRARSQTDEPSFGY